MLICYATCFAALSAGTENLKLLWCQLCLHCLHCIVTSDDKVGIMTNLGFQWEVFFYSSHTILYFIINQYIIQSQWYQIKFFIYFHNFLSWKGTNHWWHLNNDYQMSSLNSLGPRQNGQLLADGTYFQMHFLEWKCFDNKPALVQIMAWHQRGDNLLSEPMVT